MHCVVKKFKRYFMSVIVLLCTVNIGNAQTTGKIVGQVKDALSGQPLPGANVIIEGTHAGAATDLNGDYFIINVSPGKYSLLVRMMGFETVRIEAVNVSVNRTANVNVEMREAVIAGEEVVVVADKVTIKKDQTGSIKNVSSDQINILPVESIGEVIEMQAGIVKQHFRGGRITEVSHLVDGVQIDESFSRESSTVELETEAVQDLEVITGTFNAEYGRAMSGIVNLVTKDGRNDFHGSFSGYMSNYFTSHNDVFIGLKNSQVTRNKDYKIQLEGPIWRNNVTFFTNLRYQNYDGHLNGIYRFNVNDFSDFTRANLSGATMSSPWDVFVKDIKYYSEHTGDNSYTPMNSRKNTSFLSKVTFKPHSNFKFSLMYTLNDNEWQNYNHGQKYKPYGRATNYERNDFYLLQINHLISPKMFYDLKLSYLDNWNGSYLYKDPFDPHYVANNYNGSSAGGFSAGGQNKGHYERTLKDLNAKYDITWQVNKRHGLKSGFVFTSHNLENNPIVVRDKKYGTSAEGWFKYDSLAQRMVFNPYEPEILPDSAYVVDHYNKKPYEYSVYLQDKMEFEEMVINLGLRYDYFNANTVYPSQGRNPANQLNFPDNPERMSTYQKAKPQVQISPRFGLSYTLADKAVLHFSYGHFFQMPPLYSLYQNHRFLVPPGNFDTVHGNPLIKAEKTVQYEMGIWQEIMQGMSLETSVYYRDIYDLQSAIVVTTYNQIKYGLFANKDYGNVKGLELKFDYFTGPLSFFLNYTLQYTRGNADNPTSTFSRAGQSIDPISRLIPLEWDQRHTLNMSLGYNMKNYGATLTGYFNSGLAYTYRPIEESPLSKQTLYPNNASRPSTITVDLKSHYDIELGGEKKLRIFLSIYNLLDRLNEERVDATTGRAYTSIIRPTQIATFRSNFNDIYDASQDPSMFTAPREIKLGLGLTF